MRQARFSGAYTFQYSPRPGTPAATMDDQVPPEVVKDRYLRLAEVVNQIAWDEGKALVGRSVELMVAEGEGRKDAATHRLSGRGPDSRLVHFNPGGADGVRPGDMVIVEITYAAPHHLVADGPVLSVRRTRAGDAWERRNCGADAPTGRRARHADHRRARPVAAGVRLRLSRPVHDSLWTRCHVMTPSSHSQRACRRRAHHSSREPGAAGHLARRRHARSKTCPHPSRTVSLPSTAASRSRSRSASRCVAVSWKSRPSSSTISPLA